MDIRALRPSETLLFPSLYHSFAAPFNAGRRKTWRFLMKTKRILSLFVLLSLLLSLLSPLASAETEIAPAAPESQTESVTSSETGSTAAQDTTAAAGETTAADGEMAAADGETAAAADTAGTAAYTVQAKAALLIEMNTNQVLLEQNADQKVYPASLTKIMTCLLALENGKLDDEITVSASALKGLDEAGSTAGLVEGETLPLREILYCIMLSSANEACNVVAEYVAGSVDKFVDMMNAKAKELGCTGTHFANPHGLHNDNHYTTARDLSIIAKAALQNSTFVEITSTATHDVPATNKSPIRHLVTTNYLESKATTSEYYYEYAKGVKTGYTRQAGRCLISTADNGKLKLLSVVCGADTVARDDGSYEFMSFVETKKLFDYGFAHWAYAKVLSTLYPIAQIPVLDSAGAEAAVLAPDQQVTALLPADFQEDKVVNDIKLLNDAGVEAPITKGQKLGTVTVSYEGKELGTANLVAITDIARSQIAAQATSTKSFLAANWWKLLVGALVAVLILWNLIAILRRARRRRARRLRRERERNSGRDPIPFPGTRRGGRDDED